jgi:hypothetical protein
MADFNNGLAVNGPLTISDEVTASVHFGAVVKAIIDDCSRHTDGGAWRKQCQGKSWFTEALGGEVWIGQQASISAAWAAANSLPGAVFQATATAGPLTSGKFYVATSATTATEVFRGISRDYPDAVLWVAEASRVVGYDMTKPGYPMWMVFVDAANYMIRLQSTATCVAAFNGALFAGCTGGAGGSLVNFVTDSALRVSTASSRLNGGVGQRNSALTLGSVTGANIVNQTVNDVAITVLDTAPIDPATGLPVPTIAVATSGGVSVIKDDGTVVNDTYLLSTSLEANSIKFVGLGYVWGSRVSTPGQYFYYLKRNVIPSSSTSSAPDAMYRSSASAVGSPAIALIGSGLVTGIDRGAAATTTGLNLLRENPTTPSKGMVSYITNTYNTGWQVGDSRGAYLADSVAETVTASGELVLTPDFATDTNWTKTGTASISGGVANIPADNSGIYQSVATVVGRTYVYTATVVTANAFLVFYVGLNGTGTQMLDSGSVTTTGAKVYTFVAQSNTSFIRVHNFATGGVTAIIDNISVKLAESDRSVKNNGLVLNGTLTKTAVASGAGLVAYSGFSASNYLTQPYLSLIHI